MYALGIIDAQNDFMNPDGALAVPGADAIKSDLVALYLSHIENGTPIFFTADCHKADDEELSTNGGPFPPHCMEGTKGQQLIDGLWNNRPNKAPIFTKQHYDVFHETLGSKEIVSWLKANRITEVELVGVVGNICVQAAALGFIRKHGIRVIILNDYVVWMDIDENNNEAKARKTLTVAGVTFH